MRGRPPRSAARERRPDREATDRHEDQQERHDVLVQDVEQARRPGARDVEEDDPQHVEQPDDRAARDETDQLRGARRERQHGGGEQGEGVERGAVEDDLQRLAAEDVQALDAGARVEQRHEAARDPREQRQISVKQARGDAALAVRVIEEGVERRHQQGGPHEEAKRSRALPPPADRLRRSDAPASRPAVTIRSHPEPALGLAQRPRDRGDVRGAAERVLHLPYRSRICAAVGVSVAGVSMLRPAAAVIWATQGPSALPGDVAVSRVLPAEAGGRVAAQVAAPDRRSAGAHAGRDRLAELLPDRILDAAAAVVERALNRVPLEAGHACVRDLPAAGSSRRSRRRGVRRAFGRGW